MASEKVRCSTHIKTSFNLDALFSFSFSSSKIEVKSFPFRIRQRRRRITSLDNSRGNLSAGGIPRVVAVYYEYLKSKN